LPSQFGKIQKENHVTTSEKSSETIGYYSKLDYIILFYSHVIGVVSLPSFKIVRTPQQCK
jgi:hypothetical protein